MLRMPRSHLLIAATNYAASILQDILSVAAYRAASLKVGIEHHGRFERLVGKQSAHSLVVRWVVPKIEPGGDVPVQMGIDQNTSVFLHGPR